MKSRLVTLAVIWACSTTAPGAAQADEEFGRTGPYAGIAGVLSIPNFTGRPPRTDADNTVGYTIRAGYRFLSFLAGEAQFEHLPDQNVRTPIGFTGATRRGNSSFEFLTLTGNAKLVYPSGPLQPYALAGVGWTWLNRTDTRLEGNDDGFVTKAGGGIDFYFTENIVGTLEGAYLWTFGDVKNYDYVTFTWGFAYRF